MTIKERLDKEKDNLTKIILFYDGGLFYNCVEKSAYAFHTKIKPFKIHVKTLKGLEEPYISLGVPVDKIDSYLQGYKFEKDENNNIIAHLKNSIDIDVFLSWKQNILAQYSQDKQNKDTSNKKDVLSKENTQTNDDKIIIFQCLHEIRALNIASMTPMEAMNVLNELHQRVKNINI